MSSSPLGQELPALLIRCDMFFFFKVVVSHTVELGSTFRCSNLFILLSVILAATFVRVTSVRFIIPLLSSEGKGPKESGVPGDSTAEVKSEPALTVP